MVGGSVHGALTSSYETGYAVGSVLGVLTVVGTAAITIAVAVLYVRSVRGLWRDTPAADTPRVTLAAAVLLAGCGVAWLLVVVSAAIPSFVVDAVDRAGEGVATDWFLWGIVQGLLVVFGCWLVAYLSRRAVARVHENSPLWMGTGAVLLVVQAVVMPWDLFEERAAAGGAGTAEAWRLLDSAHDAVLFGVSSTALAGALGLMVLSGWTWLRRRTANRRAPLDVTAAQDALPG